jgi:cytochrome oxidase Cu insertion factor (SCO1/SenC/PrrC family)
VVVLLGLAQFGGRRDASTPLPVLREVGSFVVTNQSGAVVTAADLRGRPWAIDLIFTRCAGPCPQLTQVMRVVQESLPQDSRAGLMSITSDPEFDVPSVLREYAARVGADADRWQFVTGSRAEVRRLATEQLLLVLVEKSENQRVTPEDLFLHSTFIVVVDRAGRLRTAVEGLEPGAAGKVVDALRRLERE